MSAASAGRDPAITVNFAYKPKCVFALLFALGLDTGSVRKPPGHGDTKIPIAKM